MAKGSAKKSQKDKAVTKNEFHRRLDDRALTATIAMLKWTTTGSGGQRRYNRDRNV